jgi:hypothetical protein
VLGIDTNVLVRLLVEDDAEQTQRARTLVERTVTRGEGILVSSRASNKRCSIGPTTLRVLRTASSQPTTGDSAAR